MVNAQEYINQKYPKEKRSEITELDINEKTLEGDLDLTDFIQLIKLDLSNNYLTRIIFPTDARKLIYLDITNNDFSPQDLSVFSQLTNLKELIIGTKIKHWTSSGKEKLITRHKLKTGIYNKFFGSLKPLKNLNKLEKLDISNTDIDSGLEYLPESLKTFYCENVPCEKVREWVRKRIIQEEESLKYEDERARNGLFSCYFPLNIADCSYELQTWRENNLSLIKKIKENDKLLNIYDIIGRKIFVHERDWKVLDIINFRFEEKTIEIRKELYQEKQAYQELPPKQN